jgi:hypothetical protein
MEANTMKQHRLAIERGGDPRQLKGRTDLAVNLDQVPGLTGLFDELAKTHVYPL